MSDREEVIVAVGELLERHPQLRAGYALVASIGGVRPWIKSDRDLAEYYHVMNGGWLQSINPQQEHRNESLTHLLVATLQAGATLSPRFGSYLLELAVEQQISSLALVDDERLLRAVFTEGSHDPAAALRLAELEDEWQRATSGRD